MHEALRYLKRKSPTIKNGLLFSIFFLVIFNEFLVYFLYRQTWPSSDCGNGTNSNYFRVLLVADPQIQGENSEPWLARWDADMYLKKTFSLALSHVEPDIVIFLGDLMDEGSRATGEQHKRYVERFNSIFKLGVIPKDKTIFLPGDNDIGGENEEVTPLKVNRFDKHFNLNPDVISFTNITLFKANCILNTFPKIDPESLTDNVRIVLSHMPILGSNGFFSQEVLQRLKPHFIVSAHEHKSVHFVGDLKESQRVHIEALLKNVDGDAKWRFQTSSTRYTNEVIVPTCSYRMGVIDSGYGALMIDTNERIICYNILWLPRRLVLLFLYSSVVVFMCVYFIVWSTFALIKTFRNSKTHYARLLN